MPCNASCSHGQVRSEACRVELASLSGGAGVPPVLVPSSHSIGVKCIAVTSRLSRPSVHKLTIQLTGLRSKRPRLVRCMALPLRFVFSPFRRLFNRS